MNTTQIRKIMLEDPITQKSFMGVFPSDRIPSRIEKYPACFILNTDPSTHSGSHWLACFISTPNQLHFFDSYGNTPNFYEGPIADYATRFRSVFSNPMILQSQVSGVCGHYCVYFLHFKCRGLSLKKILSGFSMKKLCNDQRVYNFVTKRFRVRTHFFFNKNSI